MEDAVDPSRMALRHLRSAKVHEAVGVSGIGSRLGSSTASWRPTWYAIARPGPDGYDTFFVHEEKSFRELSGDRCRRLLFGACSTITLSRFPT